MACSSNPETAYPNVWVFGRDELETLRTLFDATQRQRGRSCAAGATPTNEAWFVNGHQVGRYTCLTDANFPHPRPAIVASNEDKLWDAEFFTDLAGFPYPTPQTDQELLDWFKRVSG